MLRCFAEPMAWTVSKVTLSPEESHHLIHVMRAGIGDAVTVFNGAGTETVARFSGKTGKIAELQISELHQYARPVPAITMMQALIREQKMDMVVEKGAELGVSKIVPVAVERAVVRLGAKAAESRVERWRKIALSAAKQCGGRWIPEIEPVMPLADALQLAPAPDLFLVASLEQDAVPIKIALQKARVSSPVTVSVLVGPEGDLTKAELTAARSAGAIPVSLGAAVLRAETASICILSILRYELAG
ncbi:MAG: RsmE family RNA methyltransferase [bacterium]